MFILIIKFILNRFQWVCQQPTNKTYSLIHAFITKPCLHICYSKWEHNYCCALALPNPGRHNLGSPDIYNIGHGGVSTVNIGCADWIIGPSGFTWLPTKADTSWPCSTYCAAGETPVALICSGVLNLSPLQAADTINWSSGLKYNYRAHLKCVYAAKHNGKRWLSSKLNCKWINFRNWLTKIMTMIKTIAIL